MKTYNVCYSVTVSYDAVVKAKTKKEAEAKVVEVIGEPIEVEDVREINSQTYR